MCDCFLFQLSDFANQIVQSSFDLFVDIIKTPILVLLEFFNIILDGLVCFLDEVAASPEQILNFFFRFGRELVQTLLNLFFCLCIELGNLLVLLEVKVVCLSNGCAFCYSLQWEEEYIVLLLQSFKLENNSVGSLGQIEILVVLFLGALLLQWLFHSRLHFAFVSQGLDPPGIFEPWIETHVPEDAVESVRS